jgi:hypothetical protein
VHALLRRPRRVARRVGHDRQAGQGLVEFALVAPLFFAVTFVVMEAAVVINAQLTLDNATREAVRVGALCSAAVGTWTNPNTGRIYSQGPAPSTSPCPSAMNDTVKTNLGILKLTPVPPSVVTTAPAPGSDPDVCAATGTSGGYYAAQGCVLNVSVTYQYFYFFNFLFGPGAPSITLTSNASQVSQ